MNTSALCCAAAVALTAAASFALPASAADTTQQACSQQYQAAKSAGTLNGQKWPAFYSDCAASMKTGSTAAATQPAMTSPRPAASQAPPMQAAAASAGSGHMSTQQLCSQQYQSAKTAGTLNGQKWSAFYSDCAASIKNYAEPAAAPALPSQASAQATVQTPAPSYGKASATPTVLPASTANLTAGEAAFQQRIHECASEWHSEKSAGTLPAGSQWPQFWSACNAQLKQQG